MRLQIYKRLCNVDQKLQYFWRNGLRNQCRYECSVDFLNSFFLFCFNIATKCDCKFTKGCVMWIKSYSIWRNGLRNQCRYEFSVDFLNSFFLFCFNIATKCDCKFTKGCIRQIESYSTFGIKWAEKSMQVRVFG
jgi:hypothetical protein